VVVAVAVVFAGVVVAAWVVVLAGDVVAAGAVVVAGLEQLLQIRPPVNITDKMTNSNFLICSSSLLKRFKYIL
jgi:hypothetical protein